MALQLKQAQQTIRELEAANRLKTEDIRARDKALIERDRELVS